MPPRQRPQHLLPNLALPLPIRRRRNIQNHPRRAVTDVAPFLHQPLNRVHPIPPSWPEILIVPGILADRNRHRRIPSRRHHMHQPLSRRWLKISLFIKDVIKRQQHLLLHRLHHAMLHQYRNIPNPLALGDAFHRQHAAAQYRRPPRHCSPVTNLLQSLARLQNKRLLLQQIRRPVPTNSQLRKQHQVRTQPLCALGKLQNLSRIPYEVPNRRIYLGKRNLHTISLQGTRNIKSGADVTDKERIKRIKPDVSIGR